jgi:hypothetical protein
MTVRMPWMNRKKQSRVDEALNAFHTGQKNRDLRRHKNVTIRELSKTTQLSVPLLSRIENGAVVPTLPPPPQDIRIDRDTYVFGPGDSISFESDLPHATRVAGKKNAGALLVFSNPR